MKNNFTPPYFSELIRQQHTTGYNLCNPDTVHILLCRSTLYSNSLIPHTIPIWNNLAAAVRQAPTIALFKTSIRPVQSKKKLILFLWHTAITSTSLSPSYNCSSLNKHLYDKNIVDSPDCQCGRVEDNYHFFFTCPAYNRIRTSLLNSVAQYCEPTLDIFLFGSYYLDTNSNIAIVDAVHLFIKDFMSFQSSYPFISTFSLLRMLQNEWILLGIRVNGLLFNVFFYCFALLVTFLQNPLV